MDRRRAPPPPTPTTAGWPRPGMIPPPPSRRAPDRAAAAEDAGAQVSKERLAGARARGGGEERPAGEVIRCVDRAGARDGRERREAASKLLGGRRVGQADQLAAHRSLRWRH